LWHSHEIFFSVCPKNCSVKNYLNSGLDYPELIDLYHFQNDFHGFDVWLWVDLCQVTGMSSYQRLHCNNSLLNPTQTEDMTPHH